MVPALISNRTFRFKLFAKKPSFFSFENSFCLIIASFLLHIQKIQNIMKTSASKNNESMADINDVFEQILLSEERIANEAYKQGFDKSVSEGNLEAYHLGK